MSTTRATKANTTKSAGEGEALPSASAPAVAAEASAANSETTLTAAEVAKVETSEGGFGPFQDTAPPAGAALETVLDSASDTAYDFNPSDVPFTEIVGDVQLAVRQHNGRNVVEVSQVGWVGPGVTLGAYQIRHLAAAARKVAQKLRK